MIASRLRGCLRTLRWDAADLAAALACGTSEVEGWLDGRSKVPIGVAAWIEALVKAHEALPPPSLSAPAKRPVEAADANPSLVSAEAFRRVPEPQGFFPRRALATSQGGTRPRPQNTIAERSSAFRVP
jgi:hypothetical protein